MRVYGPGFVNAAPVRYGRAPNLKCCPAFPARFGSIADARVFCEQFFGFGFLTASPATWSSATVNRHQGLDAHVVLSFAPAFEQPET